MKSDILRITDKTKEGRINKICSLIRRQYVLQEHDGLVNIIIPAKEQEGKIAVIAHHDVYPGSNGYNDNSTGVVTLLKMQRQVPDNVELVFTDAEEQGGRGSRLYLTKSSNPRIAINLDVVGLGDTMFYEEYGRHGAIDIDVDEPMIYYKGIPFSDSYIFGEHKVPNILILTGKSHDTLIHDIFEAQHCGKYDARLDLIHEDIMNKVYEATLRIITANSLNMKWTSEPRAMSLEDSKNYRSPFGYR